MPTGYWQCRECKRPFKSRYRAGERPTLECQGNIGQPHAMTVMTFRGDGWKGRGTWPHGNPSTQGRPMDDRHQKMLDELQEAESGLTTWEMDFIDSLDKLRGGTLTEKQADKLEQIWNRLLGGTD